MFLSIYTAYFLSTSIFQTGRSPPPSERLPLASCFCFFSRLGLPCSSEEMCACTQTISKRPLREKCRDAEHQHCKTMQGSNRDRQKNPRLSTRIFGAPLVKLDNSFIINEKAESDWLCLSIDFVVFTSNDTGSL